MQIFLFLLSTRKKVRQLATQGEKKKSVKKTPVFAYDQKCGMILKNPSVKKENQHLKHASLDNLVTKDSIPFSRV